MSEAGIAVVDENIEAALLAVAEVDEMQTDAVDATEVVALMPAIRPAS